MTFQRTYDREVILKGLSLFSDNDLTDVDDWIADIRNIAIADENNNVCMFEYVKPGVYFGHWFFFDRGREALKRAREVLPRLFSEFPISVIMGLTPSHLKGAIWMARQIGFTHQEEIDANGKPCVFAILRKDN